MTKGKLEEKQLFFLLTLSHCKPSWKEARAGTQTGQKPGDRR